MSTDWQRFQSCVQFQFPELLWLHAVACLGYLTELVVPGVWPPRAHACVFLLIQLCWSLVGLGAERGSALGTPRAVCHLTAFADGPYCHPFLPRGGGSPRRRAGCCSSRG